MLDRAAEVLRGDLDLAHMLRDAATKGKAAAACWIPKGSAGLPQAKQATLRQQRDAVIFAIARHYDPKRTMSFANLHRAIEKAFLDYLAHRWQEHAILKNAPSTGVSGIDDLLWRLARINMKTRVPSETTLRRIVGPRMPNIKTE
jgi:hypothetical protein